MLMQVVPRGRLLLRLNVISSGSHKVINQRVKVEQKIHNINLFWFIYSLSKTQIVQIF